MKKNSLIYVAGSRGLVGSALVGKLGELGYANVLGPGRGKLDLVDRERTESFFMRYRPEYVFLAAGKVGGIGANIAEPAGFIYTNLMIEANVIDLAWKYGARKLLFVGCPCMYPKVCRQPMKAEYLFSGRIEQTNEPYGVAKLAGVQMCQAYNRQYGTDFICGVAPSLYGMHDHFGDDGHVVASLMRRFHEAKLQSRGDLTVWGTGRPRREFLFADDAAEACIFLMKSYDSSEVINIGSGREVSVKELATAIKEVTGFTGRIVYDRRRPDGAPRRLLDARRMKALGWKPKTSLEEGLRITYNWYARTHNG